MSKDRSCVTRRSLLCAMVAGMASLSLLPALSGCADGGQGVTGTWYGINEGGCRSTLEINDDGTWFYNGTYSAVGDWNETDGGTIVLSAPLVSVSFESEGDKSSAGFRCCVYAEPLDWVN